MRIMGWFILVGCLAAQTPSRQIFGCVGVARAPILVEKNGQRFLSTTTDDTACFLIAKAEQALYVISVDSGLDVASLDLTPSRFGHPGQVALEISSSERTQEWEAQRVVALHYPPLAEQARIEGFTSIVCTLSEDGAVTAVKITSGHPLLGRVAMENAKLWRFRRNRAGQANTVELNYRFELVGDPARERKLQFSFEYPDRVRVATAPPCADHAPCNAEEEREWDKRWKKSRRPLSIP
jgi:TonB family protein